MVGRPRGQLIVSLRHTTARTSSTSAERVSNSRYPFTSRHRRFGEALGDARADLLSAGRAIGGLRSQHGGHQAFHRRGNTRHDLRERRSLAAEDWLWKRLQDLAAIRRREAQVTGPVDITVSQTELATMVGVSRQTLCMLLGRLQEYGRIDVSYRKIRVL